MRLPNLTAFLTALALTLAGVPVLAAADARAAPYVSEPWGFEIDFPAPPESREADVAAPSGPARLIRFQAEGGGLRAALNVVRFARDAFTPEEAKAALERSRDQQVSQTNGRLVRDIDVVLDGHPGKELILAVTLRGQPFRYRVRTYYAGNRQFLMSLIGSEDEVMSKAADAFFASLRIR